MTIDLLFPLPVLRDNIGRQEILKNTVLQEYNNDKNNNIVNSNSGGWHSRNKKQVTVAEHNLFAKIDSCVHQYKQSLDYNGVNHRLINHWYIINQKHDYNLEHDHPFSTISGVYYLSAPSDCGNIRFERPDSFNYFFHNNWPKSKLTSVNQAGWEISPTTGLLLLFPSYLRHAVKSNLSEDKRIVLSFNYELYY